jgi:rhodanese-related sulfurtransferase
MVLSIDFLGNGNMRRHRRSQTVVGGVLALGLMLFLSSHAYSADLSDDIFDLKDLRVKITEELPYLKVKHKGEEVIIMRHQDLRHTTDPPYDQTARNCPPFCILPMNLHSGVETIGELELLDYLRRMNTGEQSVLVIDSRTEAYAELGTIPGSVNIPFTQLDPFYTPSTRISETLQLDFNAAYSDDLWDFSNARTLILFCNGPWCGQSPSNIKMLLRLGYPPSKLKWYRGGIQSWEQFGLTTVKD